jgi:hypothetical protein
MMTLAAFGVKGLVTATMALGGKLDGSSFKEGEAMCDYSLAGIPIGCDANAELWSLLKISDHPVLAANGATRTRFIRKSCVCPAMRRGGCACLNR